MTPRELILETARAFDAAGIPDPKEDSALLLSFLLDKPSLTLRLDTETELSGATVEAYRHLARRRLSREPLQYILAEATFAGRIFHTDSRVLIPRPETALLCEWALEMLKAGPRDHRPRVLDLCTGSGCIGITLALEYPEARVTLSDISEEALAVAGENARLLKAEVEIIRRDLLEGFTPESYDLIVSNPPYIPAGEVSTLQAEVLQEPEIALNGGTDGLHFYRRIAKDAPRVLAPGGRLMMELGWQQASAVAEVLRDAGFTAVECRQDYAGIDRMIYAERGTCHV